MAEPAPAGAGCKRALRSWDPVQRFNWSLAQLDVPPDVLARVEHHYYDAGHMIYTLETDMMKLKRDLAAWLAV